jgi:LDH2 family malate/lactate/ureidoglycolate dehydrogenase
MAETHEPARYSVPDLIGYATALFAAAGCDGDKPGVVAAGLVEADLLGHTTHGLQLAPAYLAELQTGGMTATGEPEVVSDRGATVAWDGRRSNGQFGFTVP